MHHQLPHLHIKVKKTRQLGSVIQNFPSKNFAKNRINQELKQKFNPLQKPTFLTIASLSLKSKSSLFLFSSLYSCNSSLSYNSRSFNSSLHSYNKQLENSSSEVTIHKLIIEIKKDNQRQRDKNVSNKLPKIKKNNIP